MMQKLNWIVLPGALAAVLLGTGCAKLKSRDEMNKGVQSYKNAHYNDAANHFRQAVQLDPTNQNAQLYLATSYMTQWVPGADSPENNRAEKAAREEFEKVLEKDPQNKIALASLASMSYSEAGFGTPEQKAKALEEARKWNLKRVEVDPNDSEAYYSLGVIAWADAYPNIQNERVKLNMKGDDPGPIKNAKVRDELQQKYGKAVDDGLGYLQKAIDIDKENDDAMTYLNLLLRKKADLENTPEAAKADIAKAEDWANKSLDIKKAKAARPANKQGAAATS
jgi:tetratricopeptide (TPR) repeat protein